MNQFPVQRIDGRSDAEVLVEVVRTAQPGTLLTYENLALALSGGAARSYDRRDVQSAVNRAERRMAVEQCRALMNVRNRGYRVALAGEHQKIAGRKKDRASTLLKRGLTILQHVDWDAMDENTRRAHEGQLMVVGALHAAMTGIDSRLRRIEQAVANRNEQ